MRTHHAYILASRSRTLYVGVTGNLYLRVWDHKRGVASAFTKKYKVNRLVYHEDFLLPGDAILCEKRWKGWTRARKIERIVRFNPTWEDLSDEWDFTSILKPERP